MSEVVTPPARSATVPTITPLNAGRLVGPITGKLLKAAGKQFDQDTGELTEQKHDLCIISIGRDGAPPLPLKVEREAYDRLGGGDIVEVQYELCGKQRRAGAYTFVDYWPTVTSFKRLRKGDGKLQEKRGRAQFQDMT